MESDVILMRDCGVRPTRQRLAIFETLRASTSHPTAEELHRMVLASDGSMSLATVYNTLQILCDAGLCRKVATTDQSCRYDAGRHDHVHLQDAESGQVVDLPPDLSQRLLEAIPRELLAEIRHRLGADIDFVTLQFVGRPTASAPDRGADDAR